MGILSDEQAASIAAKLESAWVEDEQEGLTGDEVTEEAEATAAGDDSGSPEEEAAVADMAEVLGDPDPAEGVQAAEEEAADASAEDGEGGEDSDPADPPKRRGHSVPYDRFKQVNDRMKAAEAKGEAALKRIEELESRSSQPREPEVPDWAFDDEAPQPDMGMVALAEIERFKLDREVSEVVAGIPDAPETLQGILYEAVARDPSVSLRDVAQGHMAHRAAIEEAAIARYLAKHGSPAPTPAEGEDAPSQESAPAARRAAPRRPKKAASTSGSRATTIKPRSISEASDEAEKWLRKMPFR